MVRYSIVPWDELMQPEAVLAEDWTLVNIAPELQDDEDVIGFLARRWLLPNIRTCRMCERPMTFQQYRIASDGFTWRCTECKRRKQIREGSIFWRSHLPLKKLLLLMNMWTREATIKTVCNELGVQKNTVTDWYCFIREVCQEHFYRHPVLLGGIDENGHHRIVEIDENCYFSRKSRQGSNRQGCWVFGVYERETGRFILQPVSDRTRPTLEAQIRKCILPATRIMSNPCAAYEHLDILGGGVYMHDVVDKDNSFDIVHPDIHTQNIKCMWVKAKRLLTHQGGMSEAIFRTYLVQFMWENEARLQLVPKFAFLMNCIREQFPGPS